MADALPPPEGGSQRPAKKSFFKKPSWQKAEVKPEAATDDATEFFSRRSNFQDVLAEQETRRKEKIIKKLEESDKRKSDEMVNSLARDGKRRKFDDSSEEDTSDLELSNSGRRKREHERIETRMHPGDQISPRKQKTAREESSGNRYNKAGKSSEPVTVISDSDSDQELGYSTSKSRRRQHADRSPIEESVEDGDLMESKFREWERQRELKAKEKDPSSGSIAVSNSKQDPPASTTEGASDLSVQILVTSPIAGTQPILFKMYITQRLGQVKDTWCRFCELSEALASTVFLTHQNKRVYDVTTAKALGVTPDNIDEMGNLHLIAVTPELFEESKNQPARSESIAKSIEDAEEAQEIPPEDPTPKVITIKILLRAKGHEDFKLEVRPETTFGKIANAFRTRYKISKDQRISLIFDGEELDPDTEMKDSEVEEMDSIEVHIN